MASDASAFERASLKLAESKQKQQMDAKMEAKINSKTTIYVVFACTVSASAGLLFGYE